MSMPIDNSHLEQNQWENLDDRVAESILARLPVADYFRSQFVCRRWESIICSPFFGEASEEYFNRRPWFFMVCSHLPSGVVYDVEVDDWRHIDLPIRVPDLIHPLAASAGLLCCISAFGALYVCNPLTGSIREIDLGIWLDEVKAITMHDRESFYEVYVVCWKSGCLHMWIFSSSTDMWTEFPMEMFTQNGAHGKDLDALDAAHFQMLANVYETNFFHRKELAAVTAVNSSGNLVVYYVEPWGCLVGCNVDKKIAVIYPPFFLGTLGLASCNGRVVLSVLMEEEEDGDEIFRLWGFDSEEKELVNIATMPLEMSKDCSGANPDITCSGYGDYMMVCVSSVDYNFTKVVLYNIVEDTWKELPPCLGPRGHQKRLTSGFGFMPNIENIA